MREEWKPIAGYEGKYFVSNLGRVKTADRVLKPFDNGNGYLVVGLTTNKKVKNHYVHRLVVAAFVGDIPSGMVVNHLDYNRQNNYVGNLEIVSQKSNVRYSADRLSRPKNKTCSRSGEKHIRLRKNRYEVEILYKGIGYYCGRHELLSEAIKARDAKYEEINYYR